MEKNIINYSSKDSRKIQDLVEKNDISRLDSNVRASITLNEFLNRERFNGNVSINKKSNLPNMKLV